MFIKFILTSQEERDYAEKLLHSSEPFKGMFVQDTWKVGVVEFEDAKAVMRLAIPHAEDFSDKPIHSADAGNVS
jgi:hypothetical protein